MDVRQENAVADIARLLDGMPGAAMVRIVPAGCTTERAQGVPWPVPGEERQAARKEIVVRLSRLTVDARILIVRQGESLARGWCVPWPAPDGLFGRTGGSYVGFAASWAAGDEPGEAEGGEATPVVNYELVPAGEGKPYKTIKVPRNRFSADCWDDCRALLQEMGRAMSSGMIDRELSRRGLAWSMRVISATLTEAAERGMVEHDRQKGGYRLPTRPEVQQQEQRPE